MNARLAIFEVKCVKKLDDLPEACEAALEQIEDRRYAESFWDNYNEKLRYGIAFYKKRCLVGRKT